MKTRKCTNKVLIFNVLLFFCLISVKSQAQLPCNDINETCITMNLGLLNPGGNITPLNQYNDIGEVTLPCSENLVMYGEVNAGGAAEPFMWTLDGNIFISSNGNQYVENLTQGEYLVGVTHTVSSTCTCRVILNEADGPTTTVANDFLSCYGDSDGEVSVTVQGGAEPYTYEWFNGDTDAGVNNLSEGMYTVTVTDAEGCVDIATAVVVEPDELVAMTVDGSVLCNEDANGTVNVSISGGTEPYTYSWNDSNSQITATASNLGIGTYTVTVTDNRMCTTTATAMVSGPSSALSITFTTNPASCSAADGQATATGSGGTSPYTYQWDASSGNQTSQTATLLTAGSYNITVTDANGCIKTETTEVMSMSTLVAQSSGVTNVICNGDCNGEATVMPSSGTAPYTYSWNDTNNQTTQTATNLCAGDYIATVMDTDGCVATQPFTVTEPAELAISVNSITASCVNNSSGAIDVQVTGGATSYAYQWDNNAGMGEDPSGLSGGTYNLTVTDSNGCTKSQEVSVPVNPIQTTNLTETICPGESYPVGNNTYTIEGEYTDVLMTYLGCDSTVNLNLTVEEIQIPPDLEQTFFGGICGSQVITVEDPNDDYDYVWRTDGTGEVIDSVCTALNIKSDPTNFFLDIKTTTGTCLETVPFTIDLNTPVDPTTKVLRIGQTNTLFCNRNDFVSYQWGREDKTTLCPEELAGEVYQNYVAQSIDETNYYYWVIVEDEMNCTQKLYYGDDPFMKVIPEEPVDYGEFSVRAMPNPNDGIFHLELSGNDDKALDIYLYDALGREVYYRQFDKLNFTERIPVSLSQLNRGIYFVRVNDNKDNLLTEKIIIK